MKYFTRKNKNLVETIWNEISILQKERIFHKSSRIASKLFINDSVFKFISYFWDMFDVMFFNVVVLEIQNFLTFKDGQKAMSFFVEQNVSGFLCHKSKQKPQAFSSNQYLHLGTQRHKTGDIRRIGKFSYNALIKLSFTSFTDWSKSISSESLRQSKTVVLS